MYKMSMLYVRPNGLNARKHEFTPDLMYHGAEMDSKRDGCALHGQFIVMAAPLGAGMTA
jgi:hypothetical protein